MEKNKENLETKSAPQNIIIPFDESSITTLRNSYSENPPNSDNIHDIYIYRMILAYDELSLRHDKLQIETEKHPNGVKALKQNIIELTSKLNKAHKKIEDDACGFRVIDDNYKSLNKAHDELCKSNAELDLQYSGLIKKYNELVFDHNNLQTKKLNSFPQKFIRFFRGVK